jgi:hypothetical protein
MEGKNLKLRELKNGVQDARDASAKHQHLDKKQQGPKEL